jgi:head-tail adaptor
MNPGKLNTRIVIKQLTKTSDGFGGFQAGSTSYISIWANYKQLKGPRSSVNGQRQTKTDVELICRTNTIDFIDDNINSNWFFQVEGESKDYRISDIYESDYKNYTTIIGVKVGS